MIVEEIKKELPKKFKPITIEITFESLNELIFFKNVLGKMPYEYALGLANRDGEKFDSTDVSKIISPIYRTLSNIEV